ncbi:hypothetical protein DASC09_049690 [Saccharomycopsis crataegensis]|uniref:Dolichyl-phosphate-mannose--protein mannosyltransferase n=1 Tax=Saccharomycopsis crataegensis TaxID=43959 RepID=A0AAV5QSD5_9ASCO|nr:hypothetical protein DASC09_049690 [Saccharomycopsis crataegensis]
MSPKKVQRKPPIDDPIVEFQVKKGVERPFVVTSPSPSLSDSRSISSPKEKATIVALVFFSALLRFNRLEFPDSPVFHESNVGTTINNYMTGDFFTDAQPPLVKMLYTGVAYVFGYDASFDFKTTGQPFAAQFPYVALRSLPAILGVGTVLFLYLTLRASGCRIASALTASLLLAIENGNITTSRFFLLDSPFMFFVAATAYSMKKFESLVPFTIKWYKSLLAIGFGVGCALSSKWEGLGTVAWAGVMALIQLWFIWGDLTVTPMNSLKHFVIRAFGLLVFPIILYLVIFSTHLSSLFKNSHEAAFMSQRFRQDLLNNDIPKSTVSQVGIGSVITLRHLNSNGGFLHSHNHSWETGSKQRQVTLYPHADENNEWVIELYNETTPPTEFVPLKDNMKIRLRHKLSYLRLHSHDHPAPASKKDWLKEVSGYGYVGFQGDANDDFVVEIVKHESEKGIARKEVQAIDTVFRLRHAMTHAYLFSYDMKLPDYAFNQQEVTTSQLGLRKKTYWYIESNQNSLLSHADAKLVSYKKISLWRQLVEVHSRMWNILSDRGSASAGESNPSSWPLLLNGVSFWSSASGENQIYFLGNAVTWLLSALSLGLFFGYLVYLMINYQRGYAPSSDPHLVNYLSQSFGYAVGWGLHWITAFFIGRRHFIHEYLPALYFQILVLGHTLDVFLTYVSSKQPKVVYLIMILIVVLAGAFLNHYSSLIGGDHWSKAECLSSQLLSGWDFDCSKLQ